MLLDKTNIDSATRLAEFSERVTYLRAITENCDMDDRFYLLEGTNESDEKLSAIYEEVMLEGANLELLDIKKTYIYAGKYNIRKAKKLIKAGKYSEAKMELDDTSKMMDKVKEYVKNADDTTLEKIVGSSFLLGIDGYAALFTSLLAEIPTFVYLKKLTDLGNFEFNHFFDKINHFEPGSQTLGGARYIGELNNQHNKLVSAAKKAQGPAKIFGVISIISYIISLITISYKSYKSYEGIQKILDGKINEDRRWWKMFTQSVNPYRAYIYQMCDEIKIICNRLSKTLDDQKNLDDLISKSKDSAAKSDKKDKDNNGIPDKQEDVVKEATIIEQLLNESEELEDLFDESGGNDDPTRAAISTKVRKFKASFKWKVLNIRRLFLIKKFSEAKREIDKAKRDLDDIEKLVHDMPIISDKTYGILVGVKAFLGSTLILSILDEKSADNAGALLAVATAASAASGAVAMDRKADARKLDEKSGTHYELNYDSFKRGLLLDIKKINGKLDKLKAKLTKLEANHNNSNSSDNKPKDADSNGIPDKQEAKGTNESVYEFDDALEETVENESDNLIIGNYHSSDEVDKMLGLTNNQVAAYENALDLYLITESDGSNRSDYKEKLNSLKTSVNDKMADVKSLVADKKFGEARDKIKSARKDVDDMVTVIQKMDNVSDAEYAALVAIAVFAGRFLTKLMRTDGDVKASLLSGLKFGAGAGVLGTGLKVGARYHDKKTGDNKEVKFDEYKKYACENLKGLSKKLSNLEREVVKLEENERQNTIKPTGSADKDSNGIPDKQEDTVKESVDIGSLMDTFEEMFPVTEKTTDLTPIHESLDVDDNTKAMLESAYTNWKNAEAKLEDSRYDLNPTVRTLVEKKAARLGNEYKAMCEKAASKE